MNPRAFTLSLVLVGLAIVLAVVVRTSNRQNTETPMPVVPLPVSTSTVEICDTKLQIAFLNTQTDPNMLDCTKTEFVTRAVCGSPSVEKAMEELLKGPTAFEKVDGYLSTLPEGLMPPTWNGTQLDFDAELEAGVAGSCRVGAIRAQILNTAMANGAPTSTVLSIDGRTEDILQP
ncbi:MAG: GerMN domain-containing protein [Patescibacteria group bacterium]|jgi:spore germination protein GerM